MTFQRFLQLHTPLLGNDMQLWAQDLHTDTRRSYLNNLLIRHSRHKEILFVLIRVELDAVRDLPVGEV